MSHIPVMLAEVLAALEPKDGEILLDATFGGGGYAAAILAHADCVLWAIDRDPAAITRGAALAARHPGRLHLTLGNFGDMLALLDLGGVTALDGVVLDLGVSSYQIDEPERGFSFRHDGPLDMRMSQTGPSAADLVASLPEADLADTLYQFGEERLSRRIARAIVADRHDGATGRDHTRGHATRARRHAPGHPQLSSAAHPGERRAWRDQPRPGVRGNPARPRRPPGGRILSLSGGPAGETFLYECDRPRALAVAA